MGAISDMCDIDRFLRSPEGQEHLQAYRRQMRGRTVEEVHFTNQGYCVGVGIAFADSDEVFECSLPELDVDALRADFEEVLEREYYKDYPERKRD